MVKGLTRRIRGNRGDWPQLHAATQYTRFAANGRRVFARSLRPASSPCRHSRNRTLPCCGLARRRWMRDTTPGPRERGPRPCGRPHRSPALPGNAPRWPGRRAKRVPPFARRRKPAHGGPSLQGRAVRPNGPARAEGCDGAPPRHTHTKAKTPSVRLETCVFFSTMLWSASTLMVTSAPVWVMWRPLMSDAIPDAIRM